MLTLFPGERKAKISFTQRRNPPAGVRQTSISSFFTLQPGKKNGGDQKSVSSHIESQDSLTCSFTQDLESFCLLDQKEGKKNSSWKMEWLHESKKKKCQDVYTSNLWLQILINRILGPSTDTFLSGKSHLPDLVYRDRGIEKQVGGKMMAVYSIFKVIYSV
uniref:Uncharacterized protein n=1 Tax=Molossus molossus TaxID=27622 RepID=A0A7J8F677_MOLMO|nr:hypothetical protein HJG59_001291 [Molossus molossus]